MSGEVGFLSDDALGFDGIPFGSRFSLHDMERKVIVNQENSHA